MVLFSVWFTIQSIIQKRPAAAGSGFSVLLKNVQCITQRLVHDSWCFFFKIRPAASDSGLRVLLKNVQGIIQRLVDD